MNYNKYIDHTLLKPDCTDEQIEKLCKEAKEYDFASVCVNSSYVKKCADISQPLDEMCPYVYEHAYSPHLASRIEGNPVVMDVVKKGFHAVMEKYDYGPVEGSGGILCPICFDEKKIQLEDIVKELELESVIVADAGLGTINSVVLTAEYMKMKNMPVKGVIFNHFHPGNVMEEDNIVMCEYMTGLTTLAKVRDGDTELDIDIEVLISLYK